MNNQEDVSPIDALEAQFAGMPKGRYVNDESRTEANIANDVMDHKDGDGDDMDQKDDGGFSWNGLENNVIWEQVKAICRKAPHGCNIFLDVMKQAVLGPTLQMANSQWDQNREDNEKAVNAMKDQIAELEAQMGQCMRNRRKAATKKQKTDIRKELERIDRTQQTMQVQVYDSYKQQYRHLTQPADFLNADKELKNGSEQMKLLKTQTHEKARNCQNDCEFIEQLRQEIRKWKTRNDSRFQTLQAEYAAEREYLLHQGGVLESLKRKIWEAEAHLEVRSRKNETRNDANKNVQAATNNFLKDLYTYLNSEKDPRAALQAFHEEGVHLCDLMAELTKHLCDSARLLCKQQIKASVHESLNLKLPMAESYQDSVNEVYRQMQTIMEGDGGIKEIEGDLMICKVKIERAFKSKQWDLAGELEDEEEKIQARLDTRKAKYDKYKKLMLNLKNDWEGKSWKNDQGMRNIYIDLAQDGDARAEAEQDPDRSRQIKEETQRWKQSAEETAKDVHWASLRQSKKPYQLQSGSFEKIIFASVL